MRGGSDLDTVALRMWSYLSASDQEQSGLSGDLSAHMEAVRLKQMTKQVNRIAKRQQQAAAVGDEEAKDIFATVMKEGRPVDVPESFDDDAVFRFVTVRQMNAPGCFDSRHGSVHSLLDSMVGRGLFIRSLPDGSQCLGCRHHTTKQFHGLSSAVAHFMSYGFHRADESEVALHVSESPAEGSSASSQAGTALPRQDEDGCFFSSCVVPLYPLDSCRLFAIVCLSLNRQLRSTSK